MYQQFLQKIYGKLSYFKIDFVHKANVTVTFMKLV